MIITATSLISPPSYTQKAKSKNLIKKDKFYSVKTAKTMTIPAHTVHIDPCVLNVEATTPLLPAQNHLTSQLNVPSETVLTQITTKVALSSSN